jgi:DNA adenine methylase
MKYMGSKNKIAKEIAPIMLAERKPGQPWVEPFVGGGNMIDKVNGPRIGSDLNPYLIALFQEMQKEDFKAPVIPEWLYLDIKKHKGLFPEWMVGFAGFQLSYGAIWFNSYRRDSVGKRDYAKEAVRNVGKQAPNVRGIKFYCSSYDELPIPDGSLIYCDPPYADTVSYKVVDSFNHDKFWEWCRGMAKKGHTVFISEYTAPYDFVAIWEKEVNSSLTKDTGGKKAVEKLFMYRGF